MMRVNIINIAILFICITSCAQFENVEWNIPNGYEGPVFLFYGVPGGEQSVYVRDRRMYEIPEDGMLLTDYMPDKGMRVKDRYFYEMANGQRVELSYLPLDSLQDAQSLNLDSMKIYVYKRENIGPSSLDKGDYVIQGYRGVSFIVGHYTDLQDHYGTYLQTQFPRDTIK